MVHSAAFVSIAETAGWILCNKGPFYAWGSDPMGFGEYMIAVKEQIVPFKGISFEEAAIAEPMGVALGPCLYCGYKAK